jgi:hypothetical protein
MKQHEPLKKILSLSRPHWDQDSTRSTVREGFSKALRCRTPQMGAEVYASDAEERVVYHTCKSRSCSSCGYRATANWQRGWWATLPDTNYKGVTFTMPKELWPLFRDNRRLAHALPILAAKLMEARIRAHHGVSIGVLAVLHTFNGQLEFNSHVHTMVTGGGLHRTSNTWVSRTYIEQKGLMQAWRRGVVALLHAALEAGQLCTDLTPEQIDELLRFQANRPWVMKIQSFRSKEHFLRYAGRYVRRPPIAQRRIMRISNETVTFWAKDKKLGRRVAINCSLDEFVDRWAQHIPERYQHAVHSFGLFAPRTLRLSRAAVFAILGQQARPRPRPRRWAESIKRDFGHDPLIDSAGNRMRWVRRIPPGTIIQSCSVA